MTPDELRQRLADFAVRVYESTKALSATPESYDLARQLRRSARGAASNHRSAGRARSHREFTSKVGEAVEEADETLFWLEQARACKQPITSHAALEKEARELVAILTASHTTAKAKDEAERKKRELRKPRSRAR
jgi:four helix bundle protein